MFLILSYKDKKISKKTKKFNIWFRLQLETKELNNTKGFWQENHSKKKNLLKKLLYNSSKDLFNKWKWIEDTISKFFNW
jgi:hypothetical protein